MRNNTSKVLDNDGGAVAIMVALLAVVLFGMAAFAVDMGMAYASKRELSVTSDAASLAGANAAAVAWRTEFPAATPCTTAVADAVRPEAAEAAVAVYDAQLPVNSDGDPTVTVTCADAGTMDVKVDASATHATVFGAVLGANELNPGATATARVSGSPAYSGIRPFAICIDDVDLANPAGSGETKQTAFYFTPKATDEEYCATPAGNWALVDLDGGSNSVGGKDDSILDWTENGFTGALDFPTQLEGSPGAGFNPQKVQTALSSLIGQVVLFPVAQEWIDEEGTPSGGANGKFVAPGLVAAEVCGWYMTPKKNDGPADGCWDGTLIADAPADADLLIQWRQVNYATSYGGAGGPDAECDLSTDPYCVPAVRLHL